VPLYTDHPTPGRSHTLPYLIAVTVILLLTIVLYLWQQVERQVCLDDPTAPLPCESAEP
jgi:hypothetical protein